MPTPITSLLAAAAFAWAAPPVVLPSAETEPVAHGGDAADDPAIWVDPTDPARSVILGTDNQGAIEVYDLFGERLQRLDAGKVNNIDLRSDFLLKGRPSVIVAGSNLATGSIDLWTLDPVGRKLQPAGSFPTGLKRAYGLCMYRSAKSGGFFIFATSPEGNIEQYRLDERDGRPAGTLVRSWKLDSETEGLAADDELGALYACEERVGVWRFDAEPDAPTKGSLIDHVRPRGHITADAEGIALWRGLSGQGYIVVSGQGGSLFFVYDRAAPNAFLGSFQIGASASIDAVSGTDGVEIASASLGAAFPCGLMVVQDDENTGFNQNFKLVPWEHVARAMKPALRVRP